MRKQRIIAIVVVLAAIVGVTAYLNRGDLAERREAMEKGMFTVTFGEVNIVYKMDDIKELGETGIKATLRGSGRTPVEYSFTGVPLRNLFIDRDDINIDTIERGVVRSVDGFAVAFTLAEMMAEDNIYIVYKVNGEPLGTREDGGTGPYRIIVRQDPFAMRWARYAVELELK
ncbi:MAG: hypothetical protein AAGB97_06680 [Dehalococcoidia bacterium]|nr:hypothetical protein [Chloroflexota bacterium]MBT9161513.1 hypothetical protein [Chloroflexota bacterium]